MTDAINLIGMVLVNLVASYQANADMMVGGGVQFGGGDEELGKPTAANGRLLPAAARAWRMAAFTVPPGFKPKGLLVLE